MASAHEPPDTTPPPPEPPPELPDEGGDRGPGDEVCGALGVDCVCVGGGFGTDCGGCEGPCRPSELGFATGGSCGTAEDAAPAADPPVEVSAPDDVFEASDRPGATAETSPAMPAVSAAVPAITHRRVRPTRAMAASRASAARDWSVLIR
jgi:hypothetical protein